MSGGIPKRKVFCIGLGRTGTTTFGDCMVRLGFRHLGRTSRNNRARAQLDFLATIDYAAFARLIRSFDSVDDYPIPLLYPRLRETWPDARFVLTTRVSTEAWVESVINEFNRKRHNDGENFWHHGQLFSLDRRALLARRYEAHIRRVRDFFAGSPDLLEVCWESGDGWSELCDFLGTEKPTDPFPQVNRSVRQDAKVLLENMLSDRQFKKASLFLRDVGDARLATAVRDHLLRQLDGAGLADGSSGRSAATTADHAGVVARPPRASGKRYRLAVCSIFRDEARFLAEWLEFHRHAGVEHFYLYNDRSEDDYLEVLAPWVRAGLVTLTDWPEQTLEQAYNHCLQARRGEVEWMAFIDLDEFLFSPSARVLPDVLGDYEDVPAIFVFWALFGSAGHVARPEGPVIESYTRRQSLESALADTFDHGTRGTQDHVTGWSRDGKSIVRTDAVETMANHLPRRLRHGVVVDEQRRRIPQDPVRRRTSREPFSYDILRINHYWSKSIEDLARRSRRGSVFDRRRPPKRLERLLEREGTLNQVHDELIVEVLQRLKCLGA